MVKITHVIKEEWFPRVFPFTLFMAFIAVEEIGVKAASYSSSISWVLQYDRYLYYPVKTLLILGALYYFRKRYTEINIKDIFIFKNFIAGTLIGVIVFFLWISLDWDFATQSKPDPFNPSVFSQPIHNILNISFRLAGSSLVVPVFEELFWRSFIVRYIINPKFTTVALATFTWPSFIISSVLFAMEHNLWVAGFVAGILYNILLYYSKNIMTVIWAHGVTNFILGVYIIWSDSWQFW